MATVVLSGPPVRLGASRAGEKDTRGLDYTNVFQNLAVGDSVASVTSVTIARRDGVTLGSNDVIITPSGAVGPFILPNAAGVPNMMVAWWIGSNAALAGTVVAPAPVDYQGTVTAVSALGRTLIRDFYIIAVPGLG